MMSRQQGAWSGKERRRTGLAVLAVAAALAGVLMGGGRGASAQETKETAPATTQEARAEFEKLRARQKEVREQLMKLQDEFKNAEGDAARQAEIEKQFYALIEDFRTKTLPRMVELATPMYVASADDLIAEQVVLSYLHEMFLENNYDEVLKYGKPAFEAGRRHPIVLNFYGIAAFAAHDFAEAKKVLTEAEKAGGELFAKYGVRYVDECDRYASYWEVEKKIRQAEEEAPPEKQNPRVKFKTTKGEIEFELFEDQAPNTVANFISLIENKKYDGVKFHRVISTFMAQGGDPNTLDNDPLNDGGGGPGYKIACECYRKDARLHFSGSLSMAHAGKDTGGSQFFITHLPTAHLNPDAEAMRGHTVFGRVVSGLNVARALRVNDKIESAEVVRKRDHEYKPKTTPSAR